MARHHPQSKDEIAKTRSDLARAVSAYGSIFADELGKRTDFPQERVRKTSNSMMPTPSDSEHDYAN